MSRILEESKEKLNSSSKKTISYDNPKMDSKTIL